MKNKFLNGKLQIEQAQFRAGHDSLLLACFAPLIKEGVVIDVGCGAGTVLACYALRSKKVKLVGIEKENNVAKLALKNLKFNNFQNRSRVIVGDVLKDNINIKEQSAHLVMMNPPYWKEKDKHCSSNLEKKNAKFKNTHIQHYIKAACKLVRPEGWLCLVYPARKSLDILNNMNLYLGRLSVLNVHSKQGEDARIILVRGKKLSKPSSNEIEWKSGLIMHKKNGQPTKEARMVTEKGRLPKIYDI